MCVCRTEQNSSVCIYFECANSFFFIFCVLVLNGKRLKRAGEEQSRRAEGGVSRRGGERERKRRRCRAERREKDGSELANILRKDQSAVKGDKTNQFRNEEEEEEEEEEEGEEANKQMAYGGK